MTERVKRPISWLAMSFRAAEERIEPVNSRTQYGSASRRCSASSRASRGSSGMYQSWTTYSVAARSIGSAKRLRSRVRPVMASSTSWTEQAMMPSPGGLWTDRESTRLNSSHVSVSYAAVGLENYKDTHGTDGTCVV